MDAQLRADAESRLEAAAKTHGLQDPRVPFRDRLRLLKDTHNEAFRKAVAHYESTVLPALAAQSDPLDTWVRYGEFLARLTADGTLTSIDESGRAISYTEPQRDRLVLFIPTEDREDVLIALQPVSPTVAQQATLDLLVGRQLALQTD